MEDFRGRMKWHYVLAYCFLWISAFSYFSNFAKTRSSRLFTTDDPKIQQQLDVLVLRNPGIKTAASVYGIGCLILAVIAIVAAIGLIKFRRFGIYALLIGDFIAICNTGMYMSEINKAVSNSNNMKAVSGILSMSTSGGILISVILIVLNIIYFSKRIHLYN